VEEKCKAVSVAACECGVTNLEELKVLTLMPRVGRDLTTLGMYEEKTLPMSHRGRSIPQVFASSTFLRACQGEAR
jgi:hypothetical protein